MASRGSSQTKISSESPGVGALQRTRPFPANVKAWPLSRASERPAAMHSARDAAARPPSYRRLARSSSPSRRPISGRPSCSPSACILGPADYYPNQNTLGLL
eukprot:5505785-Prymnesium_polylepis.2